MTSVELLWSLRAPTNNLATLAQPIEVVLQPLFRNSSPENYSIRISIFITSATFEFLQQYLHLFSPAVLIFGWRLSKLLGEGTKPRSGVAQSLHGGSLNLYGALRFALGGAGFWVAECSCFEYDEMVSEEVR